VNAWTRVGAASTVNDCRIWLMWRDRPLSADYQWQRRDRVQSWRRGPFYIVDCEPVDSVLRVKPQHLRRAGINLLKPTVAIWRWASECPDAKNYKWRLNPVWHRMLYSCTHMATVGFKGLRHSQLTLIHCFMSCRQHENWSTSLTDNKGLDLAVVSVLVDF